MAPRVRRRAGAVHLHQHPGGRKGRQPELAIRRHRVPARRPERRRHRERHAVVGQCAALEEDRRHAEPRIGRSHRRHAAGPRMDGRRPPSGVRQERRPAPDVDGHCGSCRLERLHARSLNRSAPADADRRQCCAIENDRRREPHRVRLRR